RPSRPHPPRGSPRGRRAGGAAPPRRLGSRPPPPPLAPPPQEEPPRTRPGRRRRTATADPREHSRSRLLPLTKEMRCWSIPPSSACALGLTAMADAFVELQNAPDAGELSREDWLGLLVDREATSRENKRLARRLRQARPRQSAVVDVDFRAHRGLDRALFLKLASCQWIREHHHLCLIGPT